MRKIAFSIMFGGLLTLVFNAIRIAVEDHSESLVVDSWKLSEAQQAELKQSMMSMHYATGKNRIYFFVTYDCPLCKNYKPLILKWRDSLFANRNWEVNVIRLDEPDTTDENDNPTYQFYFTGEDNYDKTRGWTQVFHASVTPEVYVVDSNFNLMYYGAIDNWAYETGKHRAKATEHYLSDCIASMNKGKTPAVKFVKPVGCYIEK